MKLQKISLAAIFALIGTVSTSFLVKSLISSPTIQTLAQFQSPACKPETDNCYLAKPLFKQVNSYSTIIAAYSDLVDIYYPQPLDLQTRTDSFPIALMLQGANVDKSYYSQFANKVASYGFIVVVPNNFTSVINREGLFAQVEKIIDVLEFMKTENANTTSPVADIIDTQKLVLLGHSYGGIIGINAIRGVCKIPFCSGEYSRPKELVAGVFFGTYLRNFETGTTIPTDNLGIPIALIAGGEDSRATPEYVKRTYELIQKPPKALIVIPGANHYGITDMDNPDGARPEENSPILAQNIAVENIARWSALFLRAYALNDQAALDYLQLYDNAPDENISAIVQLENKEK